MISTNFPGGGSKGDGRNLFVMATASSGYVNNQGDLTPTNPLYNEKTSGFLSVTPEEKITGQFWGTPVQNPYWTWWLSFNFFDNDKQFLPHSVQQVGGKDFSSWTYMHEVATIEVPENASYMRVSARFYSDGCVKVERGSIATDWSPAPEDIATKQDLASLEERIAALEAALKQ